MNYSTAVPPPNNYRIERNKSEKKDFNKYLLKRYFRTQSYFSKSKRPAPYEYTEEGRNPGVGGYQIHSRDPMNATAHVFGTGERPNEVIGPDAPGIFYQISK